MRRSSWLLLSLYSPSPSPSPSLLLVLLRLCCVGCRRARYSFRFSSLFFFSFFFFLRKKDALCLLNCLLKKERQEKEEKGRKRSWGFSRRGTGPGLQDETNVGARTASLLVSVMRSTVKSTCLLVGTRPSFVFPFSSFHLLVVKVPDLWPNPSCVFTWT